MTCVQRALVLAALVRATGAAVACSPTVSGLDGDRAFLRCYACASSTLLLGLNSTDAATLCAPDATDSPAPLVARALYNIGEMQGHWWLDDSGDIEENATACLQHLLDYMPKRDTLVFFNDIFFALDFLSETVRLSLLQWPRLRDAGVSFDIFLDAILPYAVLNEKRDFSWRWRPRFGRLFESAWEGAGTNVSMAMHALSDMIPTGAAGYLPALVDSGAVEPQASNVITWRSSVSPGFLSPEQVATAFGSCTGTGILMVAAARSIGIPARLAGCSQTDVPNDDHHWLEFYDPSSPGPFGTYWHTKEGTSKGNEGGPWDSPSGPMSGCLKGVLPSSQLNTMWASAWSSPEYLPTLWAMDGPLTGENYARVGGLNVCGAYCSAWGCGPNQTSFWNQSACSPAM